MLKKLKYALILYIVLLAIPVLAVVIFDPYYHYHKPLKGLKAVLYEKEYQVVGTLDHFDYDAVIAGSSVAENYNNSWFDEIFGVKSVKAIRSYGATADLCSFLDRAYEDHDLKMVFYNLDPSSLKVDPEVTFESSGCPMYLYDDNILNDVKYIYNKDVIFEKIPYMLAKSFSDYDEGESYNWGRWKHFDLEMCISQYYRHPSVTPMQEASYRDEAGEANITLIENIVSAHPETKFIIFTPPYSMLWWDNAYREGDTEMYLRLLDFAVKRLSTYDNVRFFMFSGDRDVVLNIENNYMDTLHFSPEINRYMVDRMSRGEMEVDTANISEEIEKLRQMAYEIPEELIKPYEDVLIYGEE
ncbi:MAG: SGNH/GDSL hydrolase family protein [Lachnospiraceae bacterium]|nr:SGNH/GDSL hydrolase family protein [Lachnospiraceae bacterium]